LSPGEGEKLNGILITGGTGYLGRALVRTLLREKRSDRVCIYSRGEHAQAAARLEFQDDPRLRWFVGDVRDQQRLERAMHGCDLVVHAAALKRIETGHYNPDELVKTNVLGTMNVIEAARLAHVERVVFVSSDKAYQPVSPYGLSKALGESLVLAANAMNFGTSFAVCRYGNIAGSTGSVIPAWREQITRSWALGEPATVKVTDPWCTRFWMRIDQAVDLVLQTAATMRGGEVNIPTLPAYQLSDLATALGAERLEQAGVFALPDWEKKHESMGPRNSSDQAVRLTVDQLREALKEIP